MSYSKIKMEYENSKISFAKLSKKYNIHYKRIERKAKKNKWVKFDPTTVKAIINTKPMVIVEDDKEPFLESISEEIEMLYEELDEYAKNQKDIVMIESYMISYKLFKVYESQIDFNNIASTPAFYLQQLQIQQNNLIRLAKEIRY